VRVIGGAVAVDVMASKWLLGFCLMIFVSLALIKRYVELAARRNANLSDPTSRDYRLSDLDMVAALAAGFNAITVFALYISSDAVNGLYNPTRDVVAHRAAATLLDRPHAHAGEPSRDGRRPGRLRPEGWRQPNNTYSHRGPGSLRNLIDDPRGVSKKGNPVRLGNPKSDYCCRGSSMKIPVAKHADHMTVVTFSAATASSKCGITSLLLAATC
jgi:hypothetical protein